ncbi:MAG: phosphoribosyltransferase [Spirochaetes bacterium]|nr:phosphoribosyltransferase [Spirochaetota bacterium]
MSEKIYYSYNQIHKTVKKLAQNIIEDKYEFDVIVAIGTGGFIPARMIKTFIDRPIYTVGLKLYDGDRIAGNSPQKVQWIDEVEKKLTGKRILLIDEVDDTRTTLAYCVEELLSHNPAAIAVAVLHKKDKTKNADFPPGIHNYYCGEKLADKWVCYPWDAIDIDYQETMSQERKD